jgi:hypothetical protein
VRQSLKNRAVSFVSNEDKIEAHSRGRARSGDNSRNQTAEQESGRARVAAYEIRKIQYTAARRTNVRNSGRRNAALGRTVCAQRDKSWKILPTFL